jgi:tRNA 5-methylaminomethyl-2-thiouridine biosynthesis bifunctional protein
MKKVFDFVVIGAGIAGLLSAYRLKEFNTLLIDKKGILEGASSAAGAFLFPKIGIDSLYTRFINDSIIEAIEFYKKEGINTHTKGVLLLPRDKKDIEKFKSLCPS